MGEGSGWYVGNGWCFLPPFLFKMSIIEIEQTLGYLRQSLDKEDTLQIEEAKILICKAQNILQKYIEKTYNKTQWKHINLQPSKSFY